MKLGVICALLAIFIVNANGFWVKNYLKIVAGPSSCEGRCGAGEKKFWSYRSNSLTLHIVLIQRLGYEKIAGIGIGS